MASLTNSGRAIVYYSGGLSCDSCSSLPHLADTTQSSKLTVTRSPGWLLVSSHRRSRRVSARDHGPASWPSRCRYWATIGGTPHSAADRVFGQDEGRVSRRGRVFLATQIARMTVSSRSQSADAGVPVPLGRARPTQATASSRASDRRRESSAGRTRPAADRSDGPPSPPRRCAARASDRGRERT